jgi:hypothetical protein
VTIGDGRSLVHICSTCGLFWTCHSSCSRFLRLSEMDWKVSQPSIPILGVAARVLNISRVFTAEAMIATARLRRLTGFCTLHERTCCRIRGETSSIAPQMPEALASDLAVGMKGWQNLELGRWRYLTGLLTQPQLRCICACLNRRRTASNPSLS